MKKRQKKRQRQNNYALVAGLIAVGALIAITHRKGKSVEKHTFYSVDVYDRQLEFMLSERGIGEVCVPSSYAKDLRAKYVQDYNFRVKPAKEKGHVWICVWEKRKTVV